MTNLARLPIFLFASLLFASLLSTAALAQGEPPRAAPTAKIEVQSLPLPQIDPPIVRIDPEKSTNAYLARIPDDTRARSKAYVENGYLLSVADALYVIAVMGLLLWLRISARMRNLAQNLTRSRFWQAPIYFVQFFAVGLIASFPLTLYESYFREKAYGLLNQTFPQWLGDFAIQSAGSLALLAVAVTFLYLAIRLARSRWWLWATGLTIVFLAISALIYPVFLAPLLNRYEPLPNSPVKQEILSLARANGVPVDTVHVYDASRQSNRISANVSGLFGTTRIALTDTLLTRATPREIKAVMGHEIAHYALNHNLTIFLWLALVALVGFWLIDRLFRFLTGLFGGNWDVRTIDDPAGLPVLYAAAALYLLLATPGLNTIIRSHEAQADLFGLNTAREPDGFSTLTLKLGEYRKLDPSPLEEFVFYDHPSGRSRIGMAMRWKAEHVKDHDIRRGPASPR